MIYYKYLNLDWKIVSEKLKDYYFNNPNFLPNMSAWKPVDTVDILTKIPEIQLMVDPLSIHVRFVALFVSDYPYSSIHIDADTYSKCRINLPVLNCENTETRFFEMTEAPIKILQPNGVSFWKLNPEKCIHVDQFYLTQPVVFRNTEPHQVVSNNPNKPRVSCTIGFHENIEHLLM